MRRIDQKELHGLGDQLAGTGTNVAQAMWQACERIERAEHPSADKRVMVGLVGRRATRLLFAILLQELTRNPGNFTSHVAALANGVVVETGEALQPFPFAERLAAFNGLTQQLATGLQIGIAEKVDAPPAPASVDSTAGSTLSRAIYIAASAHNGHIDKAGAPYIQHLFRVMWGMDTDEERIVAVLHDVLEDCPEWTPQRLILEGIPETAVQAIYALTRNTSEHYEEFIQRVKKNPLATKVKIADLIDNMDLGRLPSPGPADHLRVAKYQRALDVLGADA